MLKVEVFHKVSQLMWSFLTVYGDAQPSSKEAFLLELVSFSRSCNGPCFIGGDFNLIRSVAERNKPGGLGRWSNLFNAVIESLELHDLPLGNRMFTWSNDHEDPLFQKLDHCLMDVVWGSLFPLVSVVALECGLSDHTPLLVDTSERVPVVSCFKFELVWLLREDLAFIVREVWDVDVGIASSIEEWQFRLRLLRRRLKGWNKNVEGAYRIEKRELLAQIDLIDKNSELFGLHAADWQLRNLFKLRLKELLIGKELRNKI